MQWEKEHQPKQSSSILKPPKKESSCAAYFSLLHLTQMIYICVAVDLTICTTTNGRSKTNGVSSPPSLLPLRISAGDLYNHNAPPCTLSLALAARLWWGFLSTSGHSSQLQFSHECAPLTSLAACERIYHQPTTTVLAAVQHLLERVPPFHSPGW